MSQDTSTISEQGCNLVSDPMADIWRELRERYPLLDRVVVYSVGEEIAEAIPNFFGLFLAALDDTEAAPCCFVLPRRGQMARLAATIALSVFRREFDRLVREYAEQKFSEGQKVRVLPGKHVFKFGGFADQPNNSSYALSTAWEEPRFLPAMC